MLLQAHQAVFGYGRRPVVRAEALGVAAGQCLGVFGPNGVGKSTLVLGLAGLLSPLEGRVTRRPNLRVAYVPQHRALEAHWPMTAADVAGLALSARRSGGWLDGPARAAILRALDELGAAALAQQPFASLSGGQQQRVILAGALADAPELLILDEPADGLDLANRAVFLEVLGRRKAAGLGLLLISHELEDLLDLADEVAWLQPADQPGLASYTRVVTVAELMQHLEQYRAAAVSAAAARPGHPNADQGRDP
jgi:ABC-type Mn2+/Zn2+ transport system ATPase subunit